MVFDADMLTRARTRVDRITIQQRKTQQAMRDNERENESRVEHKFKVGDKVLLTIDKEDRKRKIDNPRQGPFQIRQVLSHGLVCLHRGSCIDTVHIKKLYPFHEDKTTT
eukprot:CAMPEP_0184867310 /NCGR_PEP_ID=MMETSP0580-20130426/25933_1 /TAXON_ID=1118495 /ORGANISM="Dactyliosolen fragilissimus" /LENGTH=108 /DNA_ID=CAMNT_0027367509 /DNA_START=366 /DNA_END=688 /DNA_ORIENTATION=+